MTLKKDVQESLIAFWYQSDQIESPEVFAPIALAFDVIVTPKNNLSSDIFLNHDELMKPSIEHYEDILGHFHHPELSNGFCLSEFSSYEDERTALFATFTFDGLCEEMQDELPAVEAEAVRRIAHFNNYILYAIQNKGILVGIETIQLDRLGLLNEAKIDKIDLLTNTLFSILAISGIKISLPSIRTLEEELILELRSRFAEERYEYQTYIRELLFDAKDIILSDPSIDELQNWALFVSNTKIRSALNKLEIAIRKGSDRKLLERIGLSISENVPSLIGDYTDKPDNGKLINNLLVILLSVTTPKLLNSLIEKANIKKTFGVGYLYHLKKHLSFL